MNRSRRLAILANSLWLVLLGSSLAAYPSAAQQVTPKPRIAVDARMAATDAMSQIEADTLALARHHEAYRAAAEQVADLYDKLSTQTEQVANAAAAVDLAKLDTNATRNLLVAVGRMHDLQMTYTRQFLALQQAMQSESRRFQTLSNASKARHEAAMNAIRNMK